MGIIKDPDETDGAEPYAVFSAVALVVVYAVSLLAAWCRDHYVDKAQKSSDDQEDACSTTSAHSAKSLTHTMSKGSDLSVVRVLTGDSQGWGNPANRKRCIHQPTRTLQKANGMLKNNTAHPRQLLAGLPWENVLLCVPHRSYELENICFAVIFEQWGLLGNQWQQVVF